MNPKDLKRLRDWFARNAASLPWRLENLDEARDPYKVWISETMLQQTQVATVQNYFTRWMKRFPDVESLARAEEEEVFQYWQGLGYYSRARNILRTAKTIAGGEFPKTRKELEALPGIGAYTAGAILSLAFHQREAILDGNLVRIFSRYFALGFLPTDKTCDDAVKACGKPEKNCGEIYWEHARQVADFPKAYMHNEALMELGRRVCKVKSPDCGNCPLKGGCKAFADNRTADFPPSKKRIQKDWHGTVLVVESKDGKILAVRGGQKFFNNQITLPHFETQKSAAIGLPIQAEEFINADQVESIRPAGSFKHNITIHKMECDVLHVRLNVSARKAFCILQGSSRRDQKDAPRTNAPVSTPVFSWIEKAKATETFANSFCLKSLKLI